MRHLKRKKYPFDLKVATSQNENSRHAVDLGMDVGEPDVRCITIKDDVAHIFYLELKKKKGALIPSQIEWNKDFDENFKCSNWNRDVAYGLMEAKEKILNWLLTIHNNHI